MMQQLCRHDAISRIDALYAERTPFLFIIDYDGSRAYVEPVADVDAAECLFDFGGTGNSAGKRRRRPSAPQWGYTPESLDDYRRGFDTVVSNIKAGNSYLVNYTCRVPLETDMPLLEMFLCADARYRLWLKDRFVCFSPESFVRIDGGVIRSYPMKGTASLSRPEAERELMDSVKEAAEHATIVDLIRNDLSMVAGNVRVARYRYCERIDTNRGAICQTSSEICGDLLPGYGRRMGQILFSQLPAGSITGAPKRKTMEIISRAETYERGFYTGVMGYSDGRMVDSAVMIRYVEQGADGELCFKAGGGITAKSDLLSEYEEMKQKVYVPVY